MVGTYQNRHFWSHFDLLVIFEGSSTEPLIPAENQQPKPVIITIKKRRTLRHE